MPAWLSNPARKSNATRVPPATLRPLWLPSYTYGIRFNNSPASSSGTRAFSSAKAFMLIAARFLNGSCDRGDIQQFRQAVGRKAGVKLFLDFHDHHHVPHRVPTRGGTHPHREGSVCKLDTEGSANCVVNALLNRFV